jgi:hypothetical protein
VGGSWVIRSPHTLAAMRQVEPLLDSGLLIVHQRDDIASFRDYVSAAQGRLRLPVNDAMTAARFLDEHPRAIRRFHVQDMSRLHFRNIAAAVIRDTVRGQLVSEWSDVERYLDALFASENTNRDALFAITRQFLPGNDRMIKYIECSYFILGASGAEALPLFQDDWIPSSLETEGAGDDDVPGDARRLLVRYVSRLEFAGLEALASRLSPATVSEIGRGPEAKTLREKLAALFVDLAESGTHLEGDALRDAIGASVFREFENRVTEAAREEQHDQQQKQRGVRRLRIAGLAGGAVGTALSLAGTPVAIIGLGSVIVSLGAYLLSSVAERRWHPIYTFVNRVRSASED